MHPRKKDLVLGFVLTCVMVVFFAYATIRKPHVFFGSFLAAFLIVAVFLAYRIFAFSNDWYRGQEQREQLWFARHPRLAVCFTILNVGWTLFVLSYLVQTLMR